MIEKNKDSSKTEKIINYVLISIVLIVPLLFFLWAGHISISSVGANLNVVLNFTNEEANKIINILNNYKLLLLVFNVILIILFIIDLILNIIQNKTFYNYDLLIFVISSLIGLYYSYKLYKKNK